MRKKATPPPTVQAEPEPILSRSRRAAEAEVAIRRLGEVWRRLHGELALPCPACIGANAPAVAIRSCWRCQGRGTFHGRSAAAELRKELERTGDMIHRLVEALPRGVTPDYTSENLIELAGYSLAEEKAEDREWRADFESMKRDLNEAPSAHRAKRSPSKQGSKSSRRTPSRS